MSRKPQPVLLTVPDFAAGQPGDAALAVSAGGRLKTRLLDLSAARAPALEGRATVSVGEAPAPFEVASGSTLVWSLGALRRAPSSAEAVEPEAEAQPVAAPAPALDRTLCDRGALRDYARQLAANLPSPASPIAAKPEPVKRWAKRQSWTRVLRFPRRLVALPVRRRLLGLALLASLGVLPWVLGAPSPAQGSRATAEPSASVESPSAEAPPPEAVPTENITPPRGEAREATMSPDAGAATSRRALGPASKGLEHEAFRAAFGGNVTEAAALYEELARSRAEPVFQHAARLARQNRLHKP